MNKAMVADNTHSLLRLLFFQSQAIYYNVTLTVPVEIVGRMENCIKITNSSGTLALNYIYILSCNFND